MNKRILIYLIPLLFMIGALTPYVKSYVELLQNQQGQKMSVQNQSNQARWSYFIGTEEILKAHPLGVGYSGFYDAMTATSVYKSGQAAREESRSEANPHATFLWYATAGGYVGAVLATILFMLLLHALVIGLSGLLGKSGYFLFLFIALSYLLMGMTIPYLFNSLAMIGPAALVLGLSKARSEKIVLTEKG